MVTERDGFVLGERVVLLVDNPDDNGFLMAGDEGVVVEIVPIGLYSVGVQWDKECRGHDCDGLSEDGYGWRVWKEQIDHVANLPELAIDGLGSLLFGGVE